jgi:hypothetical protein
LSGILSFVAIPQDAPANAQNERSVPPDEQLEGSRIPIGSEPIEKFGVRRSVNAHSNRGKEVWIQVGHGDLP